MVPWITIRLIEVSTSTMYANLLIEVSTVTMDDNQADRGQHWYQE